MSNPLGIDLNVTVSDTKRGKVEYQIRGIVDVPSPPQSDHERIFLANILFLHAGITGSERRGYHLLNWHATNGGEGVKIRRCGKVPHLTDKDVISDQVFQAPDVEELDERNVIGEKEHNEWRREYQENRYCRFESRKELNQRWQDIIVNTQVLSLSGKMGLTKEEKWYRLGQHVVEEMLMRGQPPNEQNADPRVLRAMPFKDGNLCRKAAEVVSARGTDHDVIVKYGRFDHMKDLYEKGTIWMNPGD